MMGKRSLYLMSACPPLAIYLLNKLVLPRPYYLYGIDADGIYYYLARLVTTDQTLGVVPHPGMPPIYIGSLLLSVIGTSLDKVQVYLNIAHLVGLVLTAGGILFFAHLILRKERWTTSLITLTCLLMWPTWLAFSDYLGPDSYLIAVGFPTLCLLWRSIEGHPSHQRLMVWHGVGLGTCLGVKLSFLPVALACVVTWVLFAKGGGREERRSVVLAAVALIGSSTLWFLGMLPWLPDIAWDAVTGPGGLKGVDITSAMFAFATRAPVAFLASLSLTVMYVREVLTARNAVQEPAKGYLRSQQALIGTMLAFFWYEIAASAAHLPYSDFGVVVRGAAPLALVFPFVVLHLSHSKSMGQESDLDRTWVVVTATVLLLGNIIPYVMTRIEVTALARRNLEEVYGTAKVLAGPEGRIALWPGYSAIGSVGGKPAFHFEANDFGGNQFDDILLRSFPRFTLFRLPDAMATLQGTEVERNLLQTIRDRWHAFFGVGDRDAIGEIGEIVTGGERGIRPVLIVFKRDDDVTESQLDNLILLIEKEFGEVTELQRTLSGSEWIFLKLDPEKVLESKKLQSSLSG